MFLNLSRELAYHCHMETCQKDDEAFKSDGVLKFRHQKDKNNSKNKHWQVINTFVNQKKQTP